MKIQIDSRGKITIPKSLRDKYGFNHGIELELSAKDGKIEIKPTRICTACKKALPPELYDRNACAECTPVPRKIITIY